MHKAIRVPKDNLLLFCEGIARMRTREFTATEPFLRARIERIPDVDRPNHPRSGGAAAERGQPVPADRHRLARISPTISSSTADDITEPGRWPISSPAICPP